MNFKRLISVFMLMIFLFSTLGATGYERYCGCSGKIYKSIFVKSKSDCCNHSKKDKKVKSCCSLKSTKSKTKDGCSTLKDNCCDTKVTYSHFEGDATAEISLELNSLFQFPKTVTLYFDYRTITPTVYIEDFLSESYKDFTFSDPPIKNGRYIILQCQSIRC